MVPTDTQPKDVFLPSTTAVAPEIRPVTVSPFSNLLKKSNVEMLITLPV